MFHSIITILTMTAVALHAMLGCCVHHAHACDSHASGAESTDLVEADAHCSHAHVHQHQDEEDGEPSSLDPANGSGHEHDSAPAHGCDEADCSFTSAQRSIDVELMLTFSKWCPALGDVAHADSIQSLLSLHSAAETPPDPLSWSGPARVTTQVWRL